jgi:hypothetical protein
VEAATGNSTLGCEMPHRSDPSDSKNATCVNDAPSKMNKSQIRHEIILFHGISPL